MRHDIGDNRPMPGAGNGGRAEASQKTAYGARNNGRGIGAQQKGSTDEVGNLIWHFPAGRLVDLRSARHLSFNRDSIMFTVKHITPDSALTLYAAREVTYEPAAASETGNARAVIERSNSDDVNITTFLTSGHVTVLNSAGAEVAAWNL